MKQKNLSKEDGDRVEIWVDMNSKSTTTKKVRLADVPIKVKCLNEKQKELKKSIEDQDITICKGPAGGGKTYLALLMALHLMKTQPEKYEKLILVKSLTVVPGEDPGILPGTLEEKMAPFMWSFTGNLDKIFHSKFIREKLMEDEIIEVLPIAYIRGTTQEKRIVIIDEAQNIDDHIFKTIITRLGPDCKMIFLGDAEQCDFKYKDTSCLTNVVNLFKDEDCAGVVEFMESDCVRHPLIPRILRILNGSPTVKEKVPIQLNS